MIIHIIAMKRYIIKLTHEERTKLTQMTKGGRHAVREVQRAQILLKSDAGVIDEEIAEHLNLNVRTVERIRQRYVVEGVDVAVNTAKYPPRVAKFDGEAQAELVHLACSAPPEGRQRWTLQLLADKMVELAIFESVSLEGVRQQLKKKRAKTLANTKVLHSSQRECRVRSGDGRRA